MSIVGRLWAAGYDFAQDRADRSGVAEHRERLVAGAEGEVLEIGGGTGRNLRFYDDVERLVLLEPDPDMRRRGERRAGRAAVPVEVVDGDAMALPFPDESFDTVVASLVLCSVPDEERVLEEAHRVVRAGGTLRFFEHVRSPDVHIARRQDRWCRPWRCLARGCHPNRDTVSAIVGAGFEVAEVDTFDLEIRGVPAIVRPHVLGVATRS